MRALLLNEHKALEAIDMPEPAVGPDDVLVRVKACGICRSDVHGYDGSTGLNAAGPDVPAEVRAHTSGRGADVGMEVVGTSETMRSAAESLRKGGALTLAGNVSPQVEVPLAVDRDPTNPCHGVVRLSGRISGLYRSRRAQSDRRPSDRRNCAPGRTGRSGSTACSLVGKA